MANEEKRFTSFLEWEKNYSKEDVNQYCSVLIQCQDSGIPMWGFSTELFKAELIHMGVQPWVRMDYKNCWGVEWPKVSPEGWDDELLEWHTCVLCNAPPIDLKA